MRKRKPKRRPEAPQSDPARPSRGWSPLIVWALLLLFAVNATVDAVRNSGTCDELGAHIPSGYLYWASGRFSGGISNPPLGQLLITLPVRLLGYSYELFTEQHLLLFRLPVIAMGLLLGLLVYRLGSMLWGVEVGLAGLLLYALSPNILAHASLATLDLPVAFFVLLTLYLLYRYVERPGVLRIAAMSAALSAAVLVKVQALLLLGIVLLALLVFLPKTLPAGRQQRARFLATWLIVPLVVFVMINLAYLHVPVPVSGLLPPQFTEALAGKLKHAQAGHFGYLWGEYSREGWWYYFPVAILLKTPVPVLVLLAAGLFRRHSLKVVVFVIVPAVLFLGLAMRGRVNIGVRHVLVIYPFLFLLAGLGAVRLWRARWQKATVAVLGCWYVAQAALIAPHHLSYFNILVGGPTNGYKYLLDSNYDWGQNDYFLRRYVQQTRQEYQIDPDPFQATSGRILVNANALFGVPRGGARAYRWLRRFEPVNRIVYTWFEYDVPSNAAGPEQDGRALQRAFQAYLLGLRQRYAGVDDPTFRHALALLLANFGANKAAFEELRAVLARDPTCVPALNLGGELTVARKLGALKFEGDEYLSGFRTLDLAATPPPDESQIVGLAQRIGMASPFSQLYAGLADALLSQGNRQGALEALGRAVRFDPRNEPARAAFQRLSSAP